MALSREERDFLLRLAREAIKARLEDRGAPEARPPSGGGALDARRGVFVTLHKHGALRGCIGNFTSELPLYENVIEMACASAFSDPRFPPLRDEELKDIDIEISVLSPMREIDDMSEIEVGRHGIYIQKGYARGVLLPQVAIENNFDRETFLDHTCLKAGLGPGCWKEEGTSVSIFEAEIFGEKDKEG
jgi:hypothetical protein